MRLNKLISSNRTVRVIGFDDAHYADKRAGAPVQVAGIVCSETRFEGMLWSSLTKDGLDSTDVLCSMLKDSKFTAQLHLILTDGITFGGCNVVNLQELSERAGLPVVAVMRRMPDLEAFGHVVNRLPNPAARQYCVDCAGPIHQIDHWVFQCVGEDPEVVAQVLSRITDRGLVPEALRIAHLIGSAIQLGQSTNRA